MSAISRFAKHAATAALAMASATALAADAPHNFDCLDCHMQHGGSGSSYLMDFDYVNDLCISCHSAGGVVGQDIDTHDGTKHTAGAGPNDCIDCHNPHENETSYTSEGCTGNCFLKSFIGDETHTSTSRTTLGTGSGTGLCEVCHATTSWHKDDGSGDGHNDSADCILCHKHNDEAGGNGFKGAGGACQACHTTVQGNRRLVVNDMVGSESHHLGRDLSAVAPYNFDCVICHLEGDETGAIDSAYHNNSGTCNVGVVDLRDVDGGAGWQYDDCASSVNNNPVSSGAASCTTTDPRTDLTMFCLTCHDSDGVGDSTFIAAVAANDSEPAISRSQYDPFGYGSNRLGNSVPDDGDIYWDAGRRDVNSQFSTSNYAAHSISCRKGGAGGCNTCGAGEHTYPGHLDGESTSPGYCIADDSSCTCTSDAIYCEMRNNECVSYCGPHRSGTTCSSCASISTKNKYIASGSDCVIYDQCNDGVMAVDDPCAANHGSCQDDGSGTITGQQIVMSDGVSDGDPVWSWARDWTVRPTGQTGANNSDSIERATRKTTPITTPVTIAGSLTFNVWVSSKTAAAMNCTVTVGTASVTYRVTNTSYGWSNFGTMTPAAGATTLQFACDTTNALFWFDGIILTTGSFPTLGSNWDDPTLDWTTGSGGALYCECNTGYTGTECELCAAGYEVQDGACVQIGAVADDCYGNTCGGLGSCYTATDGTVLNDTFPACRCTDMYPPSGAGYDNCDSTGCTSSASFSWESGYMTPYVYTAGGGYIQCGAFTGTCSSASGYLTATSGWDYDNTTECADCHMPANTQDGKFYANNAHASQTTNWLLDLASGMDNAAVRDSNSGAGIANFVCLKCHRDLVYIDRTAAYTRMPYHQKNTRENGTYTPMGCISTSTLSCNLAAAEIPLMGTGAGCFNCHGGTGGGEIHGESETMLDSDESDSPVYSPGYAFITGGVFHRFQEPAGFEGVGGTSVNVGCGDGAAAFNLGCSSHDTSHAHYDRTY